MHHISLARQFTDIFEEGTAVARHTEFMNIYGLMTVSGVPKPGWRAFEMLHKVCEGTHSLTH